VKKVFIALLLTAVCAFGAERRMPANVRLDVDTIYVKADTTVYGKYFAWGSDAWRIGKLMLRDTSKTDATGDAISVGTGVQVRQEVCFPTGNTFGYDASKMDTLCVLCGDTNSIFFNNSEGLSSDSVITSATDTTRMTYTSLGGDSLYVSDGYYVLQSDPAPLVRFRYTGNSDMGSTMIQILNAIWVFDHIPAGRRN